LWRSVSTRLVVSLSSATPRDGVADAI